MWFLYSPFIFMLSFVLSNKTFKNLAIISFDLFIWSSSIIVVDFLFWLWPSLWPINFGFFLSSAELIFNISFLIDSSLFFCWLFGVKPHKLKKYLHPSYAAEFKFIFISFKCLKYDQLVVESSLLSFLFSYLLYNFWYL